LFLLFGIGVGGTRPEQAVLPSPGQVNAFGAPFDVHWWQIKHKDNLSTQEK